MLVQKKKINQSIKLLKSLISTPSFSKKEKETAKIIGEFLHQHQIPFHQSNNNIWAISPKPQIPVPLILLNSHHDTVKPVSAWTKNPFKAKVKDGKLFGLGSNDAGGSLVSLLTTFLHFYTQENLPFQLVFAATAEEEISGKKGIDSILKKLPNIDFAIVGEPTQMNMAVSEKGLMVIDAVAHGESGHAAREEGNNAIYRAMEDVQIVAHHLFPRISPLLGPVKMSVTQINAGTQHNVVPDQCHFMIDVRSNGKYTNKELFEELQELLQAKLTVRSFRLNGSKIDLDHPIVQRGLSIGLDYFGSSTLSDQALLPFPSIKIGPGDSARSHTADEYILLSEIEEGIQTYVKLLEGLKIKEEQEKQLLIENN